MKDLKKNEEQWEDPLDITHLQTMTPSLYLYICMVLSLFLPVTLLHVQSLGNMGWVSSRVGHFLLSRRSDRHSLINWSIVDLSKVPFWSIDWWDRHDRPLKYWISLSLSPPLPAVVSQLNAALSCIATLSQPLLCLALLPLVRFLLHWTPTTFGRMMLPYWTPITLLPDSWVFLFTVFQKAARQHLSLSLCLSVSLLSLSLSSLSLFSLSLSMIVDLDRSKIYRQSIDAQNQFDRSRRWPFANRSWSSNPSFESWKLAQVADRLGLFISSVLSLSHTLAWVPWFVKVWWLEGN